MLIFSFKLQPLLFGGGEGDLIQPLSPPLDFVALDSISPSPPIPLFSSYAKEPQHERSPEEEKAGARAAKDIFDQEHSEGNNPQRTALLSSSGGGNHEITCSFP